MIKEHEDAILETNLPEYGLIKGDIGTVVDVYKGGEGYAVEFMTLNGETIAVVTLRADQIRSVNKHDMPNARVMSVS